MGRNSQGASTAEGHYDIRRGAAAYAPIVGAFGALAIPTVTVLFTSNKHKGSETLVALACGLLVVATIGSLTGSMGLAAIGAEKDNTANLPAAVLYTAVPVAIATVSVLASFEVLAAIYLKDEKGLFAITTGAGGLAATFFVSFAVADSWQSGPADEDIRREWVLEQWIDSKETAYRKVDRITVASGLPVLVGVILRLCGIHGSFTSTGVNWLVGAGLFLCVAGTFAGIQRTKHATHDSEQKGIEAWEGYLAPMVVGLYTLALLTFLP
ncbi:hypothetical protein ABII15_24430 [Streptomyces sp. HUAS MG91]|uniref:Integral membrane protein n=1 Tax=Streptomyces tabacisoli TaxID=3156398 RepID=A0AAU8IY06_9ACTN